MQPIELLTTLKIIEQNMGREHTGRWYTRVIDIDIIDFNCEEYSSVSLLIPHPQIEQRSFVLYPLRDIMPGYKHPVSCQTVDNMVKILKDDLCIRKLGVAIWQL